MRSRIRVAVPVAALACSLLAADAAAERPLRIATMSYPVYLMALNVAGNVPGVEVSYLRPATPEALAHSDILVAHGEGVELSLDETAIRFPKLRIVETAERIARPGEEEKHLPWIWMSVRDTVLEVRNLRKALERLDPARKEWYALNAERYVARLEWLRDRMKGELDPYRGVKAVALDGASARFAREGGLDVVTAATVGEAIDVVKRTEAQVVLAGPRVPDASARRIVEETRRPVCVIDPLSGGPDSSGAYLSIMRGNLSSLRTALRGRRATKSPAE